MQIFLLDRVHGLIWRARGIASVLRFFLIIAKQSILLDSDTNYYCESNHFRGWLPGKTIIREQLLHEQTLH